MVETAYGKKKYTSVILFKLLYQNSIFAHKCVIEFFKLHKFEKNRK